MTARFSYPGSNFRAEDFELLWVSRPGLACLRTVAPRKTESFGVVIRTTRGLGYPGEKPARV
jgi:hypothetical protein